MKNVTISMAEDLAAWVRVEAAKADMSQSRWIAAMLEERRGTIAARNAATDYFMTHPGHDFGPPPTTGDRPTADGQRFNREEFYNEVMGERFPRHDNRGVSQRQEFAGKTDPGPGMAEPDQPALKTGDQHPSDE